jgi:hypothetical protein
MSQDIPYLPIGRGQKGAAELRSSYPTIPPACGMIGDVTCDSVIPVERTEIISSSLISPDPGYISADSK